ncbi:MAG: type III polyketide synthase [Bacteroidota bacterium]|nr:type III polyketide synthase [Bacteroidota bacterium]
MAYIIDIATAVPEYTVSSEELVEFYSRALLSKDADSNKQKLTLLNEKTKIQKRYSCIPDFNGRDYELFTEKNFNQSVERRTELYKKKIMPLASMAIDKLFAKTNIKPKEVTHLITVSCTGLFAPGFEFLVAENHGLQHTEKLALNFLGCYAAIKALKHAKYIAEASPDACVLIISAELCSLHFSPSLSDEDIIANLLFADGAAATFVCGDGYKHSGNRIVLNIDEIGSSYIPNTLDLMTWDISSSAFRMYLNKKIVNSIKDNIYPVVTDFLIDSKPDYWAIHPGGVKIVQAVKESLNLSEEDVEDSLNVLKHYGNMSSPTILFVLEKIFDKIKDTDSVENKKIFGCAFGPGLSIEMISFSSVYTSHPNKLKQIKRHAVEC